jgi:glycosyltransferase involved in cell wall biosynthesis
MNNRQEKWICCQLGAREHYAVARALHGRSRLAGLVTDMWVRPASPIAAVKRNLRERFHPELADATVRATNLDALAFEALARLRGHTGWSLISERNEWFQRRSVADLARHHWHRKRETATLFAYSYAARHLLEFASAQGWRTVLGQIDPGPPEERIVARINQANPAQRGEWQPAPPEYWDNWRVECALADRIVVNSAWSRNALMEEGVAAEKIRVVPLAFKGVTEAAGFRREYPAAFSRERPMRVLFLGQINLRKGVGPLLEAASLLRSEPIEFWLVGPIQIAVPAELERETQAHWLGPAPRGETSRYYQQADVFVFPTFSDGFGLTQLEAQAWRLPVVASQFCGEVVRDGVNGVLLREVSGQAIASVLLNLAHNPGRLRDLAAQSGVDDRFSLDSLASSLLNL